MSPWGTDNGWVLDKWSGPGKGRQYDALAKTKARVRSLLFDNHGDTGKEFTVSSNEWLESDFV